jgi:hypothetical protein
MPDDDLRFLIPNRSKRPPSLLGNVTNKDRSPQFIGRPIGVRSKQQEQITLDVEDVGFINIILSDISIRQINLDNKDGDSQGILASGIFRQGFIGRIYDQAYLKHNYTDKTVNENPFLFAEIGILERDDLANSIGKITPHEGLFLDIHIYKNKSDFKRLVELFLSNNRSHLSVQCPVWSSGRSWYLVQDAQVALKTAYIDFHIGHKSLTFSADDIKRYVTQEE